MEFWLRRVSNVLESPLMKGFSWLGASRLKAMLPCQGCGHSGIQAQARWFRGCSVPGFGLERLRELGA